MTGNQLIILETDNGKESIIYPAFPYELYHSVTK